MGGGVRFFVVPYRQGLMDLGAATNPWGTPAFMGAGSSLANADGASIANSFASLGSRLGDSLSQSLNQQEVAAFDGLGATFWFEAGNFTVPSEGASIATLLSRFLAQQQRPSIAIAWQFNLQQKATAKNPKTWKGSPSPGPLPLCQPLPWRVATQREPVPAGQPRQRGLWSALW